MHARSSATPVSQAVRINKGIIIATLSQPGAYFLRFSPARTPGEPDRQYSTPMVMATPVNPLFGRRRRSRNNESLQHQSLPWQLDPPMNWRCSRGYHAEGDEVAGRFGGRTRVLGSGTWSVTVGLPQANSTLSPAMRWHRARFGTGCAPEIVQARRNGQFFNRGGNALRVGDELATLLGCSTSETASHRGEKVESCPPKGQREHQPPMSTYHTSYGRSRPDYAVMSRRRLAASC